MKVKVKHAWFLAALAIVLPLYSAMAGNGIPPAPVPPRLVNDMAGILEPSQVNELERKLVAFSDSTSTQIVVVTVSSLEGYDISDFTQRLGQSWGVGSKKYNNGCVILVKPKTGTESGEADIETGYGLEHLITDGDAWNIIQHEMIPHFKQNDYYGGIDAAADAVIKFTTGEYKSDTYGKGAGTPALIIIFIVIAVVFILSRFNNNRHHTIGRRSGMGPFVFWPGSSGGDWGGFTGGSGGLGGGGGFGGFGGGGFGGGGASGSW
ncbi:MAG TPA: TPM domain-containing protein [Bacteroidales bacterium]|nr:TPM domain-containing protein [Bacteroidales bacterium]HPT02171.1 TPM domain-containing protein [Bacteroidales bacterium]